MADADYMDTIQTEIKWEMRSALIDWLLQVHLRYHMLPETLWITVNIIDRFLSKRNVSVNKLQLVGITAIFIASKYEEIMAPSVEEFAYMTEGGFSKDEILKGERIILQVCSSFFQAMT
jgi:G2/mitotic-specific cyclin 2